MASATEPIFSASAKLSFGEDLGQNFGTLFEVKDPAGRTVLGAGFPGIFNTCARMDRYALQFYARPDADTAPVKELLPRPSPIVHQSVQDLDGELYSWTYWKDTTVRRWDAALAQWEDTDLLDREKANFGDGFMRVAGKPLVYQMGQVWYDGQVVLPRPTEGAYNTFYYAAGHLCFYHTKSGEGGFTRICAVPWRPGQAQADLSSLKSVPTRKVGETPFVWGQLAGEVLTVSNWGTTAILDGADWRVIRWPVENTSYQIYSGVNYYGDLLLGQYPTGRLFRFDGQEVTELADFPPVMPGVANWSREAQSTMLYRGDLYVGVWPWAELWRYDRDREKWTLASRMFTDPPLTDQVGHPYEGDIVAYNEANKANVVMNVWGQRVCGLAPWHDSLMIATSAKGPMDHDPKMPFLTDEVYEQYGRVWKYTLPGHLSAPLEYRTTPTEVRCVLYPDRLVVEQDGQVRGEVAIDPALLADLKPAQVTWGRGLYGRMPCKLTGRKVTPALSR